MGCEHKIEDCTYFRTPLGQVQWCNTCGSIRRFSDYNKTWGLWQPPKQPTNAGQGICKLETYINELEARKPIKSFGRASGAFTQSAIVAELKELLSNLRTGAKAQDDSTKSPEPCNMCQNEKCEYYEHPCRGCTSGSRFKKKRIFCPCDTGNPDNCAFHNPDDELVATMEPDFIEHEWGPVLKGLAEQDEQKTKCPDCEDSGCSSHPMCRMAFDSSFADGMCSGCSRFKECQNHNGTGKQRDNK